MGLSERLTPLSSPFSLQSDESLHLAPDFPQTEDLIKSKAICIAYETVTDAKGRLPLLAPMSEVAGRMAVQNGAKCLEASMGGKGKLLSGVPGVEPAYVTILGGGIVGTNAAKLAAGLGSKVYILDVSANRLKYLDDIMPSTFSKSILGSSRLIAPSTVSANRAIEPLFTLSKMKFFTSDPKSGLIILEPKSSKENSKLLRISTYEILFSILNLEFDKSLFIFLVRYDLISL